MSERSTGATDAQIEAAENRCEEGGQFNAVWIRDLAEYLVPPGYAIVPVAPVRADREAVVEASMSDVHDAAARAVGVARAKHLPGSGDESPCFLDMRVVEAVFRVLHETGVIEAVWGSDAQRNSRADALRARPESDRAE